MSDVDRTRKCIYCQGSGARTWVPGFSVSESGWAHRRCIDARNAQNARASALRRRRPVLQSDKYRITFKRKSEAGVTVYAATGWDEANRICDRILREVTDLHWYRLSQVLEDFHADMQPAASSQS